MSARKATRRPKALSVDRCSHCLAPSRDALPDPYPEIVQKAYNDILHCASALEVIEAALATDVQGVHLLFTLQIAFPLLEQATDSLAIGVTEEKPPERIILSAQRHLAEVAQQLDNFRERLCDFTEGAIPKAHLASLKQELRTGIRALYALTGSVEDLPYKHVAKNRRSEDMGTEVRP